MRTFIRAVVAAVTVSLAGCTSAAGTPQASLSPTGPAPTTVSAVCPLSPSAGAAGLSGAEGVGSGMTVWALPFLTEPVYRHGKELKVVWRITGTGDPVFTATGPAGATVKPTWGPEQHSSSNWEKPGDEYGTGWVFPAAGCWTVRIVRGEAHGEFAFRVA